MLQNALYDYYWPGYEDSAPLGHNTVCLLTEVASVRIASPITRAPRISCTGGRGFPDHQPSTTFPIRGPAATGRCATSSTTTCRPRAGCSARRRDTAARSSANFYRMGKTQVELGSQGGPFAFIIPPDQFDPHAARKLKQLLLEGAVEIQRPLEPFRVADTVYPQGTDIILMAQPFRAYAKTLLEVQQYPVRRLAPGAAPDRPYDVAGWTLPLQMNVRVDRIDQYFEPPPTTRLDRVTIPAGEGLGRGAGRPPST